MAFFRELVWTMMILCVGVCAAPRTMNGGDAWAASCGRLSFSKITLGYMETVDKVYVEAQPLCQWTAESHDDWIHILEGSQGTGRGEVVFRADFHGTEGERTGTMTIAGETFTVLQYDMCGGTLEPEGVRVSGNGGEGTVRVIPWHDDCTWSRSSNDDWIWIMNNPSFYGVQDMEYQVLCNLDPEPRTGSLTLAGQTFTVEQEGSPWIPQDTGTEVYLHSVWGSSADDVFAVGTSGTIVHFDGGGWSSMSSGTTRDLYDIWGSSGDDVYAVGGEEAILHYDGKQWSPNAVGCGASYLYFGVWGSSENDVFIVGGSLDGSVILHYDGTTWDVFKGLSAYPLMEIWGSAPDDVYTIANYGAVFHYDGIQWSQIHTDLGPWLYHIWGVAGGGVYFTGSDGAIIRYDGQEWVFMESGTTYWLGEIWGSSEKDMYVVAGGDLVLHYDGHEWTTIRHDLSGYGTGLSGVWGDGKGVVYACGDAGTVYRAEMGVPRHNGNALMHPLSLLLED